jgi:anti-sigma factor RsiW
MTCRELSEFLADYVAGELPEQVRGEFAAHLSRCPDCHAFVAQYRATIQMSSAAFDDVAPEGLPEDLVRAILASLGRDA